MSNQNNNNTNDLSGTDSAAAAGGADQPSGVIPIVHQPNSISYTTPTSSTNYNNNVPQSTDGSIPALSNNNMYNNTNLFNPYLYSQQLYLQQQQQQQYILAQQQYAQQQAQQQQIMELGIQQMQEMQQRKEMCKGITLKYLRDKLRECDGKEAAIQGFPHLVGNAIRQQATSRSNNNDEWETQQGYIVLGYIIDPNTNQRTWQCIVVNGITGFRYVPKCDGRDVWDGHCTYCNDNRNKMLKLCQNEVALRVSNNIFGGSFNQMRTMSPTLVQEKLKSQSKELHILQKKHLRNKLTISLLREREKIEVPHCPEYLFGNEEEWKKKYKAIMESETDIDKKEVFDLLFEEMVVVRNRKKKHGSHHGHVYSPLFIMFGIYIRFGKGGSSGIGKDDWDFVSDVINGPKNKTLMRYHHADTTSPDGPCMETILQNAEHIGKLVEDLRHPMRHGKISIDSHKIKSRLGKCT